MVFQVPTRITEFVRHAGCSLHRCSLDPGDTGPAGSRRPGCGPVSRQPPRVRATTCCVLAKGGRLAPRHTVPYAILHLRARRSGPRRHRTRWNACPTPLSGYACTSARGRRRARLGAALCRHRHTVISSRSGPSKNPGAHSQAWENLVLGFELQKPHRRKPKGEAAH